MKYLTFIRTNMMLAAGVLTAGITMSFKMAEKSAADTAYYYNSEDMSEGAFHTASNWTTSSSAGIGCVTTGVRPCRVNVPESSTLGDILGSKDNEEVLDISVNRKSAP